VCSTALLYHSRRCAVQKLLHHFSQLLHRQDTAGEVLGVWSLHGMILSRDEGTAASSAFKHVLAGI
jgi:hypothetical protein